MRDEMFVSGMRSLLHIPLADRCLVFGAFISVGFIEGARFQRL